MHLLGTDYLVAEHSSIDTDTEDHRDDPLRALDHRCLRVQITARWVADQNTSQVKQEVGDDTLKMVPRELDSIGNRVKLRVRSQRVSS